MSAGVNKERFQREIRLAASLQHPHIVPLLTAGSTGDLLYYVMPFIEGESLRAKLAREGELPVGRGGADPARRGGRPRGRAPSWRGAPGHQARQRDDLGSARSGYRFRRGQGGDGLERRRRLLAHLPRASRWARRPTWRRSRRRPIPTPITGPTSTPWARWPTRCSPACRPSPAPRPNRFWRPTSPRRRRRSPTAAQPFRLPWRCWSCDAWRSVRPTAGRRPTN